MGVSSPRGDRNVNQNENSTRNLDLDTNRGVSQQDVDTLKQMAVSVLSESLFKKILEINQVKYWWPWPPPPNLDLDTNSGVSQQDIDTLIQMAVSVLGESLFKKILEINQVKCWWRPFI